MQTAAFTQQDIANRGEDVAAQYLAVVKEKCSVAGDDAVTMARNSFRMCAYLEAEIASLARKFPCVALELERSVPYVR